MSIDEKMMLELYKNASQNLKSECDRAESTRRELQSLVSQSTKIKAQHDQHLESAIQDIIQTQKTQGDIISEISEKLKSNSENSPQTSPDVQELEAALKLLGDTKSEQDQQNIRLQKLESAFKNFQDDRLTQLESAIQAAIKTHIRTEIDEILILFAGPNGADLAEAFSLAVSGRTPGVLHCEGTFSREIIDQCANSQSQIILIDNLFNHEWHNQIINLFAKREKFYIAVHPFAEDLKLEPKNIINYCLPVLTEEFIDKLPERNYEGGRKSNDFQEFQGAASNVNYDDELEDLRISDLAKNIITQLISNIHSMIESNKANKILEQIIGSENE